MIEYYYDVAAARFIISERRLPNDIETCNAETIQLWHGYPLKVMGNMLRNYNDKVDMVFADVWRKFDYYCVIWTELY